MKKLGLALVWLLVVVGMFSAHMNRVDAHRGDLYGARAIQSLEQLLNADGVIGDFTLAGDITLTGQLLLPNGDINDPSLGFTADDDGTGTGIYRIGANQIGFTGNGTLNFSVSAFQAAIGNGTADVPGLGFINDTNSGIYRVGPDNIGMAVGGSLVMDWMVTNAAGAGTDLVTISSTLGIMDGAPDFVRGLTVALINVNHTGGNVYGISVPALAGTGPDIDATEAAAHLDASWDYALFIDGTTQDIDHGLTTTAMFSPTLAANDNANDQRNVITIDIDIPNGSAGLINGINIDGVTDDIQTLDSAIFIEGGWDSQITFTDIGRAASANPLTGTVWMFLTDTTDYDGGAADCAIVFRDSAGNENGYIIVVSNGVCP